MAIYIYIYTGSSGLNIQVLQHLDFKVKTKTTKHE